MSGLEAVTWHDAAYRRGVLLVLLAGAFWSTMGLFVRLLEQASEWQILFYRSLALAVFLFAWIWLRSGGRPFAVFRQAGLPAVFAGLGLVLAFSGAIFAIVNTTVANALFLFAAAPFLAALLGKLVLGETVRRATWLAMGLAGCGITVMVVEGLSLGHLLGNLAALISAVGFACMTVALRWGKASDMLPAICLGGVFTGILAAVACLVTGVGFALSPAIRCWRSPSGWFSSASAWPASPRDRRCCRRPSWRCCRCPGCCWGRSGSGSS